MLEERIDDAANGSVDLSKYFQASWTGGEFTNQEWVAKYGDGDTWDSKKKASLSSAKAPSNVNKYDISKKAETEVRDYKRKCSSGISAKCNWPLSDLKIIRAQTLYIYFVNTLFVFVET